MRLHLITLRFCFLPEELAVEALRDHGPAQVVEPAPSGEAQWAWLRAPRVDVDLEEWFEVRMSDRTKAGELLWDLKWPRLRAFLWTSLPAST